MLSWDESHGFVVVDSCVVVRELAPLAEESERLMRDHGRRRAGVRYVLRSSPTFAGFVRSSPLPGFARAILGAKACVVRAILFDKTPESNWDVPWHQDTTIAVQERVSVAGFGPWSVKDGIPHVQPPAEVLGAMLTIRLHVDAQDEENGPLLVAPGTHRHGIRCAAPGVTELEACRVACVTGPGGVVLMRPLLFHASRKALRPSHRRVLHLEFAASPLPASLRWRQG